MSKGKMNIASECEAKVAQADTSRGVPTPESIVNGIEAAMDAIASTFYEAEIKIRADNGKLYRLDVELPEGVEQVGEEVEVNALAYLQRQVASVLPWKLEMMLTSNGSAQSDARRQLAWARKACDEGRVDERLVESKQRFVDQLEYQQVLVETALGAALRGYEAATGEAFVTQAERQAQRLRAGKGIAAEKPASKADAFRRSA